MAETVRERYERLQVAELLERYVGLRILPSNGDDLRFVGLLAFTVTGPDATVLSDAYDVDIRVPASFPTDLPLVWETGGRIARDYHKLSNGSLCLGAPTAVRLRLKDSATLVAFTETVVIPYLYGHSYHAEFNHMPYGELKHGYAGIREFLAEAFGACGGKNPEEFLRLAGLQKHRANKQPCPCGSGRRLGGCHNRRVNKFRVRCGRLWCRDEYERVVRVISPLQSRGRLFFGRSRMQLDIKRSA